MIDDIKIKEMLLKTKPIFLEVSKELKKGYAFNGSVICNEKKNDFWIKIENDIKI
jgi:hypothetical protein